MTVDADLTKDERALLVALAPDEHRNGRPGQVHRQRARDAFTGLHCKGLITVDACRTGIVIDPDVWWVTITDAGRAVLA